MSNKVFTAPKAYITIDNKPSGYIRELSFSETISRVEIAGLGHLTNQEVPPVKHTCQFTIGEFFIDFEQPGTKALLNRVGNVENLINSLSLGEFSFSIVIYAKTIGGVDDSNKLVTSINKDGKTIAILRDCYVDSQNFSLSEAGVSSLNTSGRYLTPICQKAV